MTTGMDQEKGGFRLPIGRRKFLAFGGAGLAVAAGSVGVAKALGGSSVSDLRSQPPQGLDPSTGRNDGAVGPPSNGVRHLALAGTDGWATMPSATLLALGGDAGAGRHGAADIAPYFPDQLADPFRTTYVFSFRNVTGLARDQVAAQKGRTQYIAPLFFSTVGEELWVTLTNLGLALRPDLVDGHTLHWHGFRNAIPFYDGVPESSISVPIGHDFTYVYRPKDSGTYMYHCHFEDVEHVTMGMQGIVFVKPSKYVLDSNFQRVVPNVLDDTATTPSGKLTGVQQKAYSARDGDGDGESWYDREFAILLGEVDVRAHFNDAHIQATDWTDFHPDFSVMNGRAYPDTLLPNSRRDGQGDLHAQIDNGINGSGLHDFSDAVVDSIDDRLASNPLSSLVEAKPGDRVLVRFVNLGFYDRTIVFPGLQVDVLGRDARYVPASAQRTATDSIQIGPGESRDVFFTAPQVTAATTFPFYDRGMSGYRGSADGTNAWVGGARSEIRVIPGLGDQKKPNGWAGEGYWDGERSVEAN